MLAGHLWRTGGEVCSYIYVVFETFTTLLIGDAMFYCGLETACRITVSFNPI
jgi:hypothetical protein